MGGGGPRSRARFVLACVASAAVAAGLIFLLQRFVFHDVPGGPGVWGFLLDFVVLFLLYLGAPWFGPRLRRFFRGPQGE